MHPIISSEWIWFYLTTWVCKQRDFKVRIIGLWYLKNLTTQSLQAKRF